MKVCCAHDKLVPVSELKPNPRNPNKHPKEQIELLTPEEKGLLVTAADGKKLTDVYRPILIKHAKKLLKK